MRRRDKTVLLWFVVILVILVTILVFQVADLLILRRAMAKMVQVVISLFDSISTIQEIRTEADVVRTIEDVHAVYHGKQAPSSANKTTSGGIFGAIGRFIKGIFFKGSGTKA